MIPGFTPQDTAARHAIATELGRTLFVEAGAGTGKTTCLVDRLVALIAGGAATLDHLAAITFTEAAAAELRDRIRQRLEEAAEDPSRSPEEQERCRAGTRDLDQAAVQTLHSFAASLLWERPLEAGLPPTFEPLDEIEADLRFDERWNAWLDEALADPALQPSLRLALSMGLRLSHLEDVGRVFHANYDLLETVVFADAPPPPPVAANDLTALALRLEELSGYARLGDQDRLVQDVRSVVALARRLESAGGEAATGWQMLAQSARLSTGVGRQPDWDRDASGANACATIKQELTRIDDLKNAELAAVRRSCLPPLLRALRTFVLNYRDERKREGRAEFHDLLIWARDLLRDDPEARAAFRDQHTYILLDEFQDTDPLQAEIALFLSSEGHFHSIMSGQPLSIEHGLVPGKLFVVGDPKQSIYRFRRADVALTLQFRGAVAGEPLLLTQNFRSQRPIIAWVNHLFERWMQSSAGQIAYAPLVHRWELATDHPCPPAVRRLGGPVPAGNVRAVRIRESQAIAALVRRIQAEGWPMQDTEATRASGIPTERPAMYGDICILLPTRNLLRALEVALEDANVPYRVEGATLVLATQEVRDLLNCLRAIDDPADQVALVAALTSPAFACSYLDILRFVEDGGRLDYLAPGSAGGPVREALGALRRYHEERVWISPALLMERVLRDRRLFELALDGRRARERWRRYHFLVQQARAFAEAGGPSLRAFLKWVERRIAEGARMVEAPVPDVDEDAARIMTVHAAKGLEFPIVMLAGLNVERGGQPDPVLFERESGRVEVGAGPAAARFESAGYASLLATDQQLDQEERVRLMYVAATRARDHLIVSLYRRDTDSTSLGAQIDGYLLGRDDLWEPIQEEDLFPLARWDGRVTSLAEHDEVFPDTSEPPLLLARRRARQASATTDRTGSASLATLVGLGSRDFDPAPRPNL